MAITTRSSRLLPAKVKEEYLVIEPTVSAKERVPSTDVQEGSSSMVEEVVEVPKPLPPLPKPVPSFP